MWREFKRLEGYKTVLIFIIVMSSFLVSGQDNSKITPSDTAQVDLADFLKKIRNKPVSLDTTKQKNRLYISVLPAAGYTLHTKFAVSIGANGAFYTDKPDRVNLSVVNINVTYSQKHQLMIPIQSNIWTKANKYNLVGNYNFYKYPEFTY